MQDRMDPTGHDKTHACVRKQRLGKKHARLAARNIRARGADVHAYPCPWCRTFHVGSRLWKED